MTAPEKRDMIRVQGNKEYLPVPQRVQWMRGEHPGWAIRTSVYLLDWDAGVAVMRAEVRDDNDRILGEGTKTETRKGFGDFVEKAETGAVGRALARAGYGTEDALDLEGDRYADAPIEQPGRGERTSDLGGARSKSATTPAPVSYRRDELAALLHEKGLSNEDALRYAVIVGIPETERPMSNDSMDRLIDAIRGHGTDEPIESPATGEAGPPLPAEDGASAEPAPVTADAPPPKPSTPEYGALKPHEKATARAYWAKRESEEEQQTLAEAMGATA